MKYIFLFFLLLLTSCVTNQENLQGTFNRSGKPITTTVFLYDTQREVQKKYRELHDVPSSSQLEIWGFAMWPEFRDDKGNPTSDQGQPLKCEIHTVRPQKINDEATLTLGHEMLHCLFGTYHTGPHHN